MMKRLNQTGALCLIALASLYGSAVAAEEYDKYEILSASASVSDTRAGAHADVTTELELSSKDGVAYAKTRDVIAELPAGIVGNPEAFPKCTTLQLGTDPNFSECPFDSQVGSIELTISGLVEGSFSEPIYNMPAPGGNIVARFGFYAALFPMFIDVSLDPGTQRLVARVEGAASVVELIKSAATFWGVPAAPEHDVLRLTPKESINNSGPPGGRKSTMPEIPFMTNPTNCEPGREVRLTVVSYQLPDAPRSITVPFPQMTACGAVEFAPTTSVAPRTSQASTGTGLDFSLSLPTKGLLFANLRSGSLLKRTEVTLPEGMTLNPSASEGLGVCSEADLAREAYDSGPNVGCPESSKLGSAVATSPVIDRNAVGSLYIAKPYENPFGSLLALYLVMKIPDRGVLVKLAGKVEPDPRTGQLVTTFDDIPELPLADFVLNFREGARAPLITPRTCGSHEAISELNPWSAPDNPTSQASAFPIESGPDRKPCPAAGAPPFNPSYLAYSTNPAAGSFSPFYMRLGREDGDQDLTKTSMTMPPGLVAKLAGTAKCPDAAIEQGRGRTGPREGRLELASPSCPANSRIGRVVAGAGTGQTLTYVEGQLYLAGPYNGAPLSVVAIVPAVAGPFDIGAVVIRQALRLHPRTGVVTVDGSASDPIPHILAGIPVSLRDLRVFVDRPEFTINPTSCEPLSSDVTLWGGGIDLFSTADDSPFGASSRFQAANCAKLGFKPRLALTLRGGTKRGQFPSLRGVYRPRPGDANLKGLVLNLPRTTFLEQGHIGTICTRVQFAAGAGNGSQCPKRAIYGHARAFTPILDEPLEGPVYLRSSNHQLPDFVASLRGLVDVEAVAKIDSKKGAIRATFWKIPDAPISKVVVRMQGGKKGLTVNSNNLCATNSRAVAAYGAHNGRRAKGRPVVRPADCGKQRRPGKRRRSR